MKRSGLTGVVDLNGDRPTRSPNSRAPKMPDIAIVGIRCLRCKAYRTSDKHPCECGHFECVRAR